MHGLSRGLLPSGRDHHMGKTQTIMCLAFAGELVMTYYSLVYPEKKSGLDPIAGTTLTILAFMASSALLKGIYQASLNPIVIPTPRFVGTLENPLYILVWLLYSAYEFAMLISVAINSGFRLVILAEYDTFTVVSEGVSLVLLSLMLFIHYFVVDYYKQLVDYNERERQGENNRLRQVSAWLRNFPRKHDEYHNNADLRRTAATTRQETAVLGSSARTMTGNNNRVGTVTTEDDVSVDNSIMDTDRLSEDGSSPPTEAYEEVHLPPITDNDSKSRPTHHGGHRRRNESPDSWDHY
ncbi:unnamed protein product [Notodromas monacha]|uniref:Uncharacterized protein n=1 Tax=Notodromas monacha TaxID=399045 RepID=A0A7R9BUI1_9CRUS|nr:unnamed protein product [Notodromas monacha]CAG0920604.1 unnamed protein product [Notodromas monacha]